MKKFLYISSFLVTDFCQKYQFLEPTGVSVKYYCQEAIIRGFYVICIFTISLLQILFLRKYFITIDRWRETKGERRLTETRACLIKWWQTSRAVINVINNSSVLSLWESRCSAESIAQHQPPRRYRNTVRILVTAGGKENHSRVKLLSDIPTELKASTQFARRVSFNSRRRKFYGNYYNNSKNYEILFLSSSSAFGHL